MLFALITFTVFCTMEGITWLTHKYVMHGFGWYLHEDHHQPKYQNVFEKNDLFFVIFAVPSSLSIYFGLGNQLFWLAAIGFGILFYGLAYFLVHDVLIHQRFKWFKHTKNRYLLGLRKAHKIHHKNMGKDDSECFGMLFVPFKYFKKPKLT
ncbi:sterol desaturase family protein [uncultured Polaribacter sp.]|uniref:sterol desaturase family protein n=1 Tax=uncultured Polaribacter sp. TaxID=174711 RepID=UPI00261BE33A|nr:sterol desaturase family protein [uncultured Polaribacter sp.]